MATEYHGRLQREGPSWVLVTEHGTIRGLVIEENNPGRHVGKKKYWIVASTNRGVVAALDRRSMQKRQQDAASGRKPGLSQAPKRSVRAVSGGSPGLGRNRRS